jgi:glycosyltransferase involved in cell wall biosynthesis/ubiquinone/menaquinone biosynthesis C-methylase UbiE
MADHILSILIPLYNEEEFVGTLLERVLAAPLPDGMGREIVVVDDGSTDGSARIVEEMAAAHPGVLRFYRQPRNQGKGAAIRAAIEHATGEFSIIQDADLEYDPREYGRLLAPLLEGKADAVYGSRFVISGERRVLYFWHSVANYILTGLCNIVSDLNLTDMETCYKAFRTTLLQSIPIRSNRFGLEPELTIKLAKRRVRLYETPIDYHGRTYDEGKKIGLKDAFDAVYVILRYAFTRDIYKGSGPDILDALAGAQRFNQWMADTIQPYIGKRVLECGAGIGNLTRVLCPRRERYIAGDIEPEYLARLRARFQHRPKMEVRHCDLANPADFEPLAGSVDSVVCLNVLEHVEAEMASLRNIYAALQPGGRAIVLVPHDQKIFGSLDTALGHFRRYSHEELQRKMEQVGFRVERILDFNRISRPAWYVTGRLLRRKTISRFQLRVFDSLVWLWRRIDRLLPWPPTSIIAIAVKSA